MPVLPSFIVTLPQLESVKLCATTFKARVVETVSPPDVPVMVNVDWPIAALVLTATVSTLFVVVEVGENVAVTPVGTPVTDKFTLPLNPYCGYTEK